MPDLTSTILDTVENFLETCPDLEGADIEIGTRTVESGHLHTMTININGAQYLVTARQVSEPMSAGVSVT